MKKKMKADNVEQLMEIVRSLQRGEDPTEATIKKETESVPKADSPLSHAKKDSKQDSKQNTGSGKTEDSDWEEDGEFERLLNADSGSFRRNSKKKENAPEVLEQAVNLLGSWKDRILSAAASLKPEKKETQESAQTEPAEPRTVEPEEAESETAARKWPENRKTEEDVSDFDENEETDVFDRILGTVGADDVTGEGAGSTSEGKAKERSTGSGLPGNVSGTEQSAVEGAFGTEQSTVESASGIKQSTAERASGMEQSAAERGSGDERSHAKENSKGGESGEFSGAESSESPKSEADVRKEAKESPAKKGRLSAEKIRSGSFSLQDMIHDVLEKLRQKGISRRELIMIGAGALLAVCFVVLIANMIRGNVQQRQKSRNVTADAGLTVTVEKEPEQWSSSYPVELRFAASGTEIQEILINGETYAPDEDGYVTILAEDWLLEAAVETGEGILNARIEIPMLDGTAPTVSAEREDDTIELSAMDARSSVKGIYYAALQETRLQQLPEYQEYSQPITYEEGTVYYFYAEDEAGNRSVPVATSMEQATGMTLSQDAMTLFPEEVGSLLVEAESADALLNDLSFTSMNPELLEVDSHGSVTALAEGTGTIKVSAAGLEDQICTVTVSPERTVTISALGDCTLGTDESFNTNTSFNAFDTVNGHAYFFQNVRDILEADDATFANLEGTLTTSTQRESKEYAFKGDPSYTAILQNGSVDVVTLANNHSSDYGEQSLTDTENALTEAEIDYCIGDTIVMKDVNGIRTAFIGIYVLADGMERETQVRETISSAKAKGAQLVIMAFHWGSESETSPDATQQALAHTAIDCGADLVVGHHPHVLQGIEKYKGKYIAYSLGNFCFGGNSAPSDLDTMIFQQTFTITKDGVEADDAITVIPCSISSAEGYNNYQPTPVSGDAAAAVISKLNERSQTFGVTLSADGTVADTGEAVSDEGGTAAEAGEAAAGTDDTAADAGEVAAGADDTAV